MPDNSSQPGYVRSDTYLGNPTVWGAANPRPERAGSIIGSDSARTGLFTQRVEVRPPGEQTVGAHRTSTGKASAPSPSTANR